MLKTPYNYPKFTSHSYDFSVQTGLTAGDALPSFALTDLQGREVSFDTYAGKTLVLETGSITCPLYVGKIKSMNALAKDFPDVQFIVIYVREAHPGKNINAHNDSEGKSNNAKFLKETEPENRTVLVDSLDGNTHTALGLLPNMAYVIGADGTVIYRADWNIPDRIKEVLGALKTGDPISNAPADFTPVSPHYSVRVLARAGGLRAVWEFISHLPQLIKQHKAHWNSRG